jgi:hypothetical protein
MKIGKHINILAPLPTGFQLIKKNRTIFLHGSGSLGVGVINTYDAGDAVCELRRRLENGGELAVKPGIGCRQKKQIC